MKKPSRLFTRAPRSVSEKKLSPRGGSLTGERVGEKRGSGLNRVTSRISTKVHKVIHRIGVGFDDRMSSDMDLYPEDPVKGYHGVRYREELNKYVSEIRPTKDKKKIWLGTYDTAEEAARAFDMGNLYCKKKIPLNFPDSPKMLKKISSKLSPDEIRNAIAKNAKEAARMTDSNSNTNLNRSNKDIIDRRAAEKAHQLVQQRAGESYFEAAAPGCSSVSYTETLPEQVETATAMAIDGAGGAGSRDSSLDLAKCFNDDLDSINFDELILGSNNNTQYPPGVYYYSHEQDNLSQGDYRIPSFELDWCLDQSKFMSTS